MCLRSTGALTKADRRTARANATNSDAIGGCSRARQSQQMLYKMQTPGQDMHGGGGHRSAYQNCLECVKSAPSSRLWSVL